MNDFLFGKNKVDIDNEYQRAIKEANKQGADAVYQQHYNNALYNKYKDYYDSIGVENPSAVRFDAKTGKFTTNMLDTVNAYENYYKDLNDARTQAAKQNKYNVYGNGLIGGLLNPIYQTSTAVGDLVSSGTKEWDNGNRDVWSDLGAGAETALTLLPFAKAGVGAFKAAKGIGTAAKAANTAKNVAHPLLNTLAKSAATGAAWSGLGSLSEYGSDIGSHLPEVAARAGIGAAFGGAMGGAGYGINTLANRASALRTLQDYMRYQSNNGIQTNLLGSGGATTTASPVYDYVKNLGKLSNNKIGQAAQGAIDTFNVRRLMGNDLVSKATGAAKNVASKAANSKAANVVNNLLKSGKGKTMLKVGGGIGGGLMIGNLLGGQGISDDNNTGTVDYSDQQAIYDYIYNGGK